MSTTKTKSPLLDSLIKHGYYFSFLLRLSKTTDDERFKNLRSEFEKATNEALNSLENNVHISDTFPTEKAIKNVLDKMKATLEKYEKRDSSFELSNLKKRIGDYQKDLERQSKQSANGDGDDKESDDQSAKVDLPSFLGRVYEKDDYEKAFGSPDKQHESCLQFCHELLPKNNQEMVIIRKRKLIHWWLGFNLIESPEKGNEVLEKLVDEEFLIPISSLPIGNMPRVSNSSTVKGYIIHRPLHATKQEDGGSQEPSLRAEKYFTVIRGINTHKSSVAVINTDRGALNKMTLDAVAADSRTIAILHLGRWSNDPGKQTNKSTKNDKSAKYVVVEDIDALESMLGRQWPKLITLSFQGIGGIVKLPGSVYKMQTLKVLDLKACPNLETLPQGIDLLTDLTHLDVSECYLLDHIPKGLHALSKLKVLKGFIINPEDDRKGMDDCIFDTLGELTNLTNLAVRARTTSFPTPENLSTLSKMNQLKKLKVIWVQNIKSYDSVESHDQNTEGSQKSVLALPHTLEKLELQAASEMNALRMLDVISHRSNHCPRKLYIRGGRLWKLDPYTYNFPKVEILRLRYLPELHIKWCDCQLLFPKLSHLEVFRCPCLVGFPCGENGRWNASENADVLQEFTTSKTNN